MDEDEEIYWAVHDEIQIERRGRKLAPIDLTELYKEFREKYFGAKIPELSDEFTCAFIKLPFDVAGIGCREKWEKYPRLAGLKKKGIRINEKLKDFPNETRVALFHEMV